MCEALTTSQNCCLKFYAKAGIRWGDGQSVEHERHVCFCYRNASTANYTCKVNGSDSITRLLDSQSICYWIKSKR